MTELAIVIPGFNCEEHIEKCIDSILNQQYVDYQIYFIDDGSTDSTKSIVEKYELTGRFRYLYQNNSGVSVARNNGLKLLGDERYVMFVDSDDWLEDGCLSIMVNSIKENNADYCFSDWKRYYYENGRIEYDVDRISSQFVKNINVNDIKLHYFRYRSGGAPWGKIFKVDIIKRNSIRFINYLPYAEDYLFNLEYLKYVNKVIYIDKPLYAYNCLCIGEGGKFRENYFDILKKIETYKQRLYPNITKDEKEKIYAAMIEQIAIALINTQKKDFPRCDKDKELKRISLYMKESKIKIISLIKSQANFRSKCICILGIIYGFKIKN